MAAPQTSSYYFSDERSEHPHSFTIDDEEVLECFLNHPEIGTGPQEQRFPLYYQTILAKYQKLLKKHPEPTSVTFCWMQGERDAKEKVDAAYADALKQLIANLRRDLKQPNLNVVIGRISDYGDSGSPNWEAVRKAQVDVANGYPQGSWVDCDDLNDGINRKGKEIKNDLHYSREGYKILGARFARQAKALVDGKKPATNGRPE